MNKDQKTNIKCPHCQKEILKENIDFPKYIGKCKACDSTVEISKEVIIFLKNQFLANIPKGISLREQEDKIGKKKNLVITKEFFSRLIKSPNHKMFALIIMASFILLIFIISGEWQSLVFFSPIIIILITKFYNKQIITINDRSIIIRNTILFYLNKRVSTKNIVQLFVIEKITHNSEDDTPNYNYPLMAKKKNGKNIKLLSLSNHKSAIYMERKIEEYLDIEDKKIKGEYFK
jgi:hypothetical protein